MSPSGTALGSTRSMSSVSPGQTVGSMLHPVTRRRSVPDDRNTSAASSHFIASDSLIMMFPGFTSSVDYCCNSEISPRFFRTKGPLSQTPAHIGTTVFHKVSLRSPDRPVHPTEDSYPLGIPTVIVSLPATPGRRRRQCRQMWCRFDCLE